MQRNSDHFKSQLKLQVKSKKNCPGYLKGKTFKQIMYNWRPPKKSELTLIKIEAIELLYSIQSSPW